MALFGKKKKAEEPVAAAESSGSPFDDPAPEAAPAADIPAAPVTPAAPAKPKIVAHPDVYTLLLGLSVVALIIACILLYLNIQAYGPSPLSGIPRV